MALTQYQSLISFIRTHGERVPTPQDIPALTCFGTAPTLVYNLADGDPIITERKLGIKGPIGEMCAFINGEQNFDVMKTEYGVPEPFWGPWVTDTKTAKVGAAPRSLGDGSYGRAFAAFPTNTGDTFNQVANMVRMLRDEKLRNRRTIYMTSWIPFMNGWGATQRTVVSPCHGFVHARVLNGNLDLVSWHRSVDVLLGFPNDMISYVALIRMLGAVTGLTPRRLIFQLSDAHIYENQLDAASEIMSRTAPAYPTLTITNTRDAIEDFRASDFTLQNYSPLDPIIVPSAI